MSEWLTYQELCNKKIVTTPDDLIPFLKRGIKPYDSIGGEVIPCPPEDHEYYILNLRLLNITTTLDAIKYLRKSRHRFKKKSKVQIENFVGYSIMFVLKELKTIGYDYCFPLDFTDEFMGILLILENSLSQEMEKIENRQKEIELIDPSKTSWEFFQEPNLEGHSFAESLFDENSKISERIWPREKLEKLYETLRNTYYRKKDFKLSVSTREKYQAIRYAKASWGNDKEKTIADMIKEIKKILDIPRSEKTIRRWIDLYAPNRRPGRRKKK